MAIQFPCGSCGKPIEVDDEWAARFVRCPFCRAMLTAPTESDLSETAEVSIAAPTAPSPNGAEVIAPEAAASAVDGANRIAVVALILVSLALVMLGVSATIMAPHRLEFAQFQESLQATGGGYKERLDVLQEFMDARGGVVPGWLVSIVLLQFTAMVAIVAAVVCGLIGVRRRRRRPFAVAALLLCGGLIAMQF